tara:strand:+ start:350 stop:487 length:138 start_codon:yes stop_codon:yes gene_type:complete
MPIESPFDEIRYKDPALFDYLIELASKVTSLEIRLKLLEEQRKRL